MNSGLRAEGRSVSVPVKREQAKKGQYEQSIYKDKQRQKLYRTC